MIIFDTANEQHIAAYVVYADSSNILYHDAECEKAVKKEEAVAMLAHGMLVYDDGDYFVATAMAATGNGFDVTAGEESFAIGEASAAS